VGLRDALSGVFSFLQSRSQVEERLAQYVIREHRRGRPLDEILADSYVANRCTPAQIERLLDRPELIHALGNDVLGDAREKIGS
jgi:hypothetical protein